MSGGDRSEWDHAVLSALRAFEEETGLKIEEVFHRSDEEQAVAIFLRIQGYPPRRIPEWDLH